MTVRRGERLADLIRAELARALREEVRDPLLGFVTLTAVRLSADLRTARVYVSVLDRDAERTLEGLRRATPFLRRLLARSAGLRFTPDLRFVFDPSLASGSKIDQLLRDARGADDAPGEPDPGLAPPAPEGGEE
jgi:ribosome-binding factor A